MLFLLFLLAKVSKIIEKTKKNLIYLHYAIQKICGIFFRELFLLGQSVQVFDEDIVAVIHGTTGETGVGVSVIDDEGISREAVAHLHSFPLDFFHISPQNRGKYRQRSSQRGIL